MKTRYHEKQTLRPYGTPSLLSRRFYKHGIPTGCGDLTDIILLGSQMSIMVP